MLRAFGMKPDRSNDTLPVQDITDREKAEEALRRSECNFRTLAEKSLQGIAIFQDRAIVYANSAHAAIMGYSIEELKSMSAEQLIALTHPLDRGIAVERARKRLEGQEVTPSVELRILRKDGSTRWIYAFNNVIEYNGRPAILSTNIDITERKEVEQALKQSEDRFRELTGAVEDVFWITDPATGRVLYISPAYEKIWGCSCQSLYDRPHSWFEAIHGEDRERVQQARATRQSEGLYHEEYRVLRQDGQVRWIRDRAFPVRNVSGQVERIVGVARDVTERRQLEEQLLQSQKLEAIGQLAGGVAHDFNNILTFIIVQCELAAAIQQTHEEHQQDLQQIREAAERAAHLTRQLLLFSRRQVMQPQVLDLNEAVTSLGKMLQRIIGEDVRLQLRLHSTPLVTRVDPGMLDQVLLNLAVNARDAMPAGGRLLIETAAKTVNEAAARLHPDAAAGSYVCLTVADTGCGIPPEILPRIFEPYFTTKGPGKGTGLGLATIYGIVQQHRGWIEVQSQPSQGAAFQLFLPASEAPRAPCRDEIPPKPRGGPETILLVEDEAPVRTITQALLERFGYRVLPAANGLEALQIWKENREVIGLLLTDLVMPVGIDGQDLARRLEAEEPDLKVIFTSGYSAEIAGRNIELRPGENFLQKPFPSGPLLATIRRSLDC